jgi:hypothetical protein
MRIGDGIYNMVLPLMVSRSEPYKSPFHTNPTQNRVPGRNGHSGRWGSGMRGFGENKSMGEVRRREVEEVIK